MEVYPRPLHHDDACGPFIKNSESIIINVLQLANGAKQSTKTEKYKWTKTTDTVIIRISSLDSYPVMRTPSELVEYNPSHHLPLVAPSNQRLPGVHRSE